MIVHGAAPLCVTVTVCPPIVSAPLRDDVDVFAVTEYVTEPFPEPLAPPVIVIQEALSVAVHAQPLPAVTATLAVPPAADIAWVVGDAAKVHAGANKKGFERLLRPRPPAPIAVTAAS